MTNPYSGLTAFTNSAIVGASDLNDHIMNNIGHLKAPPFALVFTALDTPASTTATTAVPITAGVSATLTTYGAPVQVYLKVRTIISGGAQNILNLDIDGTAYTNRVSGLARSNAGYDASYHVWVPGLATGSHTFVPTWRVTPSGTAFTVASSEPLNFWVREG